MPKAIMSSSTSEIEEHDQPINVAIDEDICTLADLCVSISGDIDLIQDDLTPRGLDKNSISNTIEAKFCDEREAITYRNLNTTHNLHKLLNLGDEHRLQVSSRAALIELIKTATYELASIDAMEGIFIDTRTAQERIIDNPVIKAAADKLMSLKGIIEYQTVRGRAALNVMAWLKKNILDAGYLTAAELRLVPLATFKDFDSRLYQAIMNSDRSHPR